MRVCDQCVKVIRKQDELGMGLAGNYEGGAKSLAGAIGRGLGLGIGRAQGSGSRHSGRRSGTRMQCVMQGLLEKRGQTNRVWKKRWFMLIREEGDDDAMGFGEGEG